MQANARHPHLDLDAARVGKYVSGATLKGRSQRVTLDKIGYTFQTGYRVPLRGRVIGLSGFSSPPGVVLAHVQDEGFPIVLTTGMKWTAPDFFDSFTLVLPQVSDGWALTVPQDASRYLLLDIAERPEDLVYGPVPNGLQGADGGNPKTTRVVVTNAAAQVLVAANPLRKGFRIHNWDAVNSIAYGYTSGVTFAAGANRGVEVPAGTPTPVIPSTGPIFGQSNVAGGVEVVIEELI